MMGKAFLNSTKGMDPFLPSSRTNTEGTESAPGTLNLREETLGVPDSNLSHQGA